MPYFWSDQYDVKIQCLGEPEADDVVHVVEDDGRKFLAYYERDGAVVGVVGGGMPGKVMKARGKIASGAPIADVLAQLLDLTRSRHDASAGRGRSARPGRRCTAPSCRRTAVDGSSMTVPPASRTRATAASMSATVHIGTVTCSALPPATPAIGCD